MRDFKIRPQDRVEVTVRNSWNRGGAKDRTPPSSVLLDVGIDRGGREPEWNCADLTPKKARAVAKALLVAAEEAEA